MRPPKRSTTQPAPGQPVKPTNLSPAAVEWDRLMGEIEAYGRTGLTFRLSP
jgi:hypothetical protein